jgi:glucose-6-phosphate-specific signal transduction histidine kinase
MEDNRNDQGPGKGVVVEDLLSENVWRALILTSAAAVILFSIYCLSHEITIIFMHLYYFPIVLLAYRYRYRGFMLATLLAIVYVGLVVTFQPGQAEVTGAFYRFAVFIGIAAVIAHLSERLAAAYSSQKEGLDIILNLQP